MTSPAPLPPDGREAALLAQAALAALPPYTAERISSLLEIALAVVDAVEEGRIARSDLPAAIASLLARAEKLGARLEFLRSLPSGALLLQDEDEHPRINGCSGYMVRDPEARP